MSTSHNSAHQVSTTMETAANNQSYVVSQEQIQYLLCLLQSELKPDSPLYTSPQFDTSSLSFSNMAGNTKNSHH